MSSTIDWVRLLNGGASIAAVALSSVTFYRSLIIDSRRYRWPVVILQAIALGAYIWYAAINLVGAALDLDTGTFTPYARFAFPVLVLAPVLVRFLVIAPVYEAARRVEERREDE